MRSYQFWFLCVLLALAFVSKSMLEPLTPLYALSLGSSPAAIGGLVAASFFLPLFLAIPMGRLADRLGSKTLITAGAIELALAPTAVAVVPSLSMLFAAQVLIGLAQLTLVVSAQKLVASYGAGTRAEGNFGWYSTFLSVGQFVGPLLAGVLVDFTTFRMAFLVAGFGGAVVAIGSRWLTPVEAGDEGRRGAQGSLRPRQLAKLVNPQLRVAILLSFAVLLSIGVYNALFPVYLAQLAFSATTIGVFMSLRPLSAILLRPMLPQIVKRLGGRTGAIMAIVAAVAAGGVMIGVGSSAITFALASVVIGAGWALSQPLSMAMTVDGAAVGNQGLVLGVRLTANRIAQFSSPLLFGLVAEFSSYGSAFILSAVTAGALGLLLFRWEKYLRSTSPAVNKARSR